MPYQEKSLAIKQAITLALNATQRHKLSYQQAITSALNAKQGHKLSYQQAITSALNATQGHKHWLSIKPLIDLYPKRSMISTQILNRVQLHYNVIKSEVWFNLAIFKVYILHVKVKRRNYNSYVVIWNTVQEKKWNFS